ncbi:hypothetical protein LCGC14_0344640 [marine sediment metagenome]|uniref:Uncharacterized protein n=1 Tax=marine sediment metagenome TaxID=412755 RepID=A0A0F9WKH5_9ZZZZ
MTDIFDDALAITEEAVEAQVEEARMSDLVERLRYMSDKGGWLKELLASAAEEIERLENRARDFSQITDLALAERDKLRARVEELEQLAATLTDMYTNTERICQNMITIKRHSASSSAGGVTGQGW